MKYVLDKIEKRRADVMERYYWYKSNGICTKCGHEIAELNKTMCSECLEKSAAHKREWQAELSRDKKDNINRKHRERKNRLIADGRCPTCGRKITDKKYKMCLECRLAARRWKRENIQRKRYKESGLCWHCGSADIVEGKNLCETCLDKQRIVAEENLKKATPDTSYFKRLNNATWVELCRGH